MDSQKKFQSVAWGIIAAATFLLVIASGLFTTGIIRADTFRQFIAVTSLAVEAISWLLVIAVIMRRATNWVCKFTPPYGKIYLALFLSNCAGFIIGFTTWFLHKSISEKSNITSTILLMIIGSITSYAIYGRIIKHPQTGPIGFGKSCLIHVIYILFIAGIICCGIVGGVGLAAIIAAIQGKISLF
jgi:uncharacterized protein YacL